MSFKATTLFLFTISALLALVKSAPASHTFNVRQYSGQNTTTNSAKTPSTPTNTNASDFIKQSGLAAQKLNSEFATINTTDPCQDGQMACINSSYAQCEAGQWTLAPCSSADLSCYALPRDDKPGISLVCDTSANALQRFVSAGLQGGITGNDTTNSTDVDDPDGDGDCEDGDDESSSTTAIPTSVTISSATPSSTDSAVGIVTVTVTESPTLSTSASSTALQRRQILSSSSTPTIAATSSDPTLSSTSVVSSSISSATSSPGVSATSSSASNGIATPTVVIGTDNIVTITVVSTVTVSATDCGAATAPSGTAATSSAGNDVASTIGTIPIPTGSALPSSSLSASTSLSTATSLSTSNSSSSTGTPSGSATVSSASTTTAASSTPSSDFGFTFGPPATATPAS